MLVLRFYITQVTKSTIFKCNSWMLTACNVQSNIEVIPVSLNKDVCGFKKMSVENLKIYNEMSNLMI